MKHTQGPWRIVDECEGPGGYLVSETIDDIAIAEVFKHNSCSEEEDKANAILIAAAPELLRLLRIAYDDFRELGFCTVLPEIDELLTKIEEKQ